jgi:hypothetical protein
MQDPPPLNSCCEEGTQMYKSQMDFLSNNMDKKHKNIINYVEYFRLQWSFSVSVSLASG